MVRYLAAAVGVVAMMSSAAMAETTVVTTHTSPGYVAPHKKMVLKRHVNRYGQMVTVKKTYRDGFSGSSVSRTKTTTDPYTGTTTKTQSTTVRE